jgi:hypothetical protein
LIGMPKSIPWNAPEHDGQAFQASEAKKIDVYSFGMLCLWLLFEAKFPASLPSSLGTPADKEQFVSFEDLLKSWKRDLLRFAISLIGEHDRLSQFFYSTLACEPHKRTTDFNFLLHLLAPDR